VKNLWKSYRFQIQFGESARFICDLQRSTVNCTQVVGLLDSTGMLVTW